MIADMIAGNDKEVYAMKDERLCQLNTYTKYHKVRNAQELNLQIQDRSDCIQSI